LEYRTTFETPQSGQFALALGITEDEASATKVLAPAILSDLDVEGDFEGEQEFKDICEAVGDALLKELEDEDIQLTNVDIHYARERGLEYCILDGDFANLDDLQSLYADLLWGVDVNRLGLADGEFYYDIDTHGWSYDLSDLLDIPLNVDVVWQVTMPGKVKAHNGDELKGRTIRWLIAPDQDDIRFQAISEPKSNTMLWIWIGVAGCIVLVFFLVVIGLVVWYLRRQRRTESSMPPEPPMA
jgi:hypothetical protein